MNNRLITVARNTAIGLGAAGAGYAAVVAWNRLRYGKRGTATQPSRSTLLDRFIPDPEVIEHHHIAIDAPAETVLATAKRMQLLDSPVIRAVFKLRQLAMGGEPDTRPHPSALLEQMQSIGWVMLAERAGREVVLGAVTQPWLAAPVFRSIPAGEFETFAEPGYVKIAWTLHADPIDDTHSFFHTETRVSTTDAESRERFRRYWSYVAPGVELIRVAMLRPLKRACERQAASIRNGGPLTRRREHRQNHDVRGDADAGVGPQSNATCIIGALRAAGSIRDSRPASRSSA